MGWVMFSTLAEPIASRGSSSTLAIAKSGDQLRVGWRNEAAEKREAANATASPSSAECPTGPGIVCLESESDDAAPPDGTIDGDLLIHKPGIGCVQGIRCNRRVVTPALRVVSARIVERDASVSSRPRRDSW